MRTSERSIPGICGRIRCSASPMEATYNTLLKNVLGTAPPPRTAGLREYHLRKVNPFKGKDIHLASLERRGYIDDRETKDRQEDMSPGLADKVCVLPQTFNVGGDEP